VNVVIRGGPYDGEWLEYTPQPMNLKTMYQDPPPDSTSFDFTQWYERRGNPDGHSEWAEIIVPVVDRDTPGCGHTD
jgi:hypothetical protein